MIKNFRWSIKTCECIYSQSFVRYFLIYEDDIRIKMLQLHTYNSFGNAIKKKDIFIKRKLDDAFHQQNSSSKCIILQMNYLFPFFRFLSLFISHLYTSDHVKLSLPSVNFQGNLVMHMRFIKPLNSNFVWMRKFTTHHSQTQYYINTHFFLFFF